ILKVHHPAFCGVSMMGLVWMRAKRGLPAEYDFEQAFTLSKTRIDTKVKMLVYAGFYHIECDDFASAQLALNLSETALKESGLDSKPFWKTLISPLQNELTKT
ncbi:MAG: hypothetical protein VXZ96_14190, partial [Myxococcota bacterium]|nr:hypothetical protein [Myxococcota bacterium]